MIRVAVSGIPRGYQFPRPDGNWLQDKHREILLAAARGVELVEIPAHEVPTTDLGGFEVLFGEGGNTTHYEGELDQADYRRFFTSSLRWIQLCSTGFSDNITPEILDGRVTLTNSPGIHTVPISESVMAAILEHAKRLSQRVTDQEERRWRQLHCSDIEGSTVLLIGLGNIGRRVARLAKAFDMKVIGTRRGSGPVPNVDVVFPLARLRDQLPEADYVVVCAPLTEETEGLLSEAEFSAMKGTAYLVNVGRGKIADEAAMMRALVSGRIAGAYLDCFAVEPLPVDSPLWGMANVFVVPHDSHSSPKIGDRVVAQFAENLSRYDRREPLLNVCDPRRGY